MILTTTVNLVMMDTIFTIHLVLPAQLAPPKPDTIVMMKPTNVTNVTQLVILAREHLITVLLVLHQELTNQNVFALMELMMMT
jgi:hypothetical protein